MIFSTNRTTALGESAMPMNKKYAGSGMLTFAQECAQDELSIFEMAIKTDIEESLCESHGEVQALHEGFIEKVGKKIKEIFVKLKEWLAMVIRSVLAKLNQYFTVDNKKFVERAEKAFKKLTSGQKAKIEFQAKWITDKAAFEKGLPTESEVNSLYKILEDFSKENPEKNISKFNDAAVKNAEDIEKKIIDYSFSDAVTQATGLETCKMAEVEKAKNELKELSNKAIKDLKKTGSDKISKADKLIKKFEGFRDVKAIKDAENSGDLTACVNNAVKIANIYKAVVQKQMSVDIQVVKTESKIYRAVVSKALVGKLSEGYLYESEEMMIAAVESAAYELDSALEEKCCKETDDEDIENVEAEEESTFNLF